ncbi:MAG: hypothetical protein K6F34_06760 [Lachnospiraceae bacterium]|nr:hypothetical protein [Lachnospiraceae bacterium]
MKRFFKILGISAAAVLFAVAALFIYFVIRSNTFSDKPGSYYVELAKQQRDELYVEDDEDPGEDAGERKDSGLSEEELERKYLSFLEPADDEYDFKWANDHNESTVLGFQYARDSKAYEMIFGYPEPTLEDLYGVIDANTALSDKYKTFLKDFSKDWLTLYPESDMSVFYHNLETLKIDEMTEQEIMMTAMNTGVAACYVSKDNRICINKEADVFDRSSDDYVVLVHEILHAARGTRSKIDGTDVSIGFFENLDYGLYEDEVMDTYFALKLQGLDRKAVYYTLQSSYYRQLMPLVEYDGNDYMNHSVNYLEEKIGEAFDRYGIDITALHYMALIDSQAKAHYRPNSEVDYRDYGELYKTQVKIYGIQHLNAEMTHEETEKEFEVFWDDITYNFDALPDPYPDMTKEQYKPYWDEYVDMIKKEAGQS